MRFNKNTITLCILATTLAACSTASKRDDSIDAAGSSQAIKTTNDQNGYLSGDGPADHTPDNLANIPDPTPKLETLHPYANRPYLALGKKYTPLTKVSAFKEQGVASWYGKKFHGQRTSSGEIYDMYGMTAAHPTLPIPSYAKVTNTDNNKSVIVRINDRGPFLHDRVIDLSYTAAYKLGLIQKGSATVSVESILPTQINALNTPKKVNSVALVEPDKNAPQSSTSTPPQPTPSKALKQSANADSGGIFLQLGAFKSNTGATRFEQQMQHKLQGMSLKVSTLSDQGLNRVRTGPFSNREQAQLQAQKLKPVLGFKPIISESK